jgi:leucine dehydrogenase
VVQGAGSVGARLIAELRDAGARVLACDVDPAKVAATGAEPVAPEAALATPCDVFAPCATGSVFNAETIPALACRVVAGAANNQLATSADGDRLQARGIVYAPDYVANAGGVIWLAGFETLGWDDAHMRSRLAAIEDTLADVFSAAESEGITTAAAADRLARARIEAGRSS